MNANAPEKLPLAPESVWSRLRFTPLGDLLRGRLTGRLDVRRAIAGANLPEPLGVFVYSAVRAARLRGSARLSAAEALIARVKTGLETGHRTDELVSSFGSPLDVAAEIRRERRFGFFSRRLSNTPLSDLFRGRLTASLDVEAFVAHSNLPPPVQTLLGEVTRRTRLWRSEKIDVARELADHFRDGLESGRTADDLIKTFGDRRKAARLIRRAKLRNRPLPWRVWRRGKQLVATGVAAIIVSYIYLAVRYFTARPTISHNYAADLNVPAESLPEDQRAWPLYREALMRMTKEPYYGWPPEKLPPDAADFYAAAEKPGDKHWDVVAQWLDQNKEEITLIRKAAARPRLGFVYGDPGNKAWIEKIRFTPKKLEISSENPVAWMLLPQIQELHFIFDLLLADAHRAAADGDAGAFVADIEAIVGMASQLYEDLPLVVVQLNSFIHLESGTNAVGEALARRPDIFKESDLSRLAHCVAGYAGGGAVRCRFAGERLIQLDLYQRIYTDDGRGDGRLTPDGPRILENEARQMALDFQVVVPKAAVQPLTAALLPSRRRMTEWTESTFDELESDLSRPLWEWTRSNIDEEFRRCKQSPLETLRYLPLMLFVPRLEACFSYRERVTQEFDATLAALALELQHRRTGTWPKTLDELVPDLLPAVPRDRFTGGPLLYRVENDRPLIYSAGPDKKDDGGQPVPELDLMWMYWPPSTDPANQRPPDGDWILWPPQKGTAK